MATTMKTKKDLKEVFAGLSSILGFKSGVDFESTSDQVPDWDMPVTVDSLSYTQADPTLNRTKIHGMSVDWCVTSTPGDVSISLTIPSIADELMSYFFGDGSAVSAMKVNGQTWEGNAYDQDATKVVMGLALLNEAKDKLFLINNAAFYATLVYENGSTTPIGIKLTGTIEASEDDEKNVALLSKVSE